MYKLILLIYSFRKKQLLVLQSTIFPDGTGFFASKPQSKGENPHLTLGT